ncbi:MAG: hypothetical protein K8R99_15275 [Actinomycetia bacterium]|nr:hypothetical protein [Actinomycetes bacterium]
MAKHAVDGVDRLVRTRWAAIGAAVAVSLGGGGLFLVDAAGGPPESNTVLIDPVRILDTRDPVNVGLNGPFVSAVSQKLQVTGSVPTTNGAQTVVPTGATGVILNVTATGTGANGFISIRPGNATGAPTTSSLNVNAGETVPNAVLVSLPASGPNAGKIDITFDAYGVAGPITEILIDVVGYTTSVALGTAFVPSGKTVTGWEMFDHTVVVTNEDVQILVELPARAPNVLTSDLVNFAADPDSAESDATCTGSISAPTAPPGKVCLYLDAHSGVTQLEGSDSGRTAFSDRYFRVIASSNGALNDDLYFRFSWAYTAP